LGPKYDNKKRKSYNKTAEGLKSESKARNQNFEGHKRNMKKGANKVLGSGCKDKITKAYGTKTFIEFCD
jgi:hypothetical protein